MPLKHIFLVALIWTCGPAMAEQPVQDLHVIDQRDPAYQLSMEHLSRAVHALRMARSELEAAEASHPFYGINIVRMLSELQPIEETLSVLLVPEQKRVRYQTLAPDGLYFLPVQKGVTK